MVVDVYVCVWFVCYYVWFVLCLCLCVVVRVCGCLMVGLFVCVWGIDCVVFV